MRRILQASLLLLALPAAAAPGTAELSLDRAAVAEILASALPDPMTIDLPGLGRATLRVLPPRRVELVAGAVLLSLPLELVEADLRTSLFVRLVPGVEPLTGVVGLRPETVRPETALPFDVDLAGWLEALALPRRLDWAIETRKNELLAVSCFLQGMTVREDRLVLQLGLSLQPRKNGLSAGRASR